MKIGDFVEWTSSNQKKYGRIIAAVPPQTWPWQVLSKPVDDTHKFLYGGGQRRSSTSYLVEVERPRGKPLLYWPNASLLELSAP